MQKVKMIRMVFYTIICINLSVKGLTQDPTKTLGKVNIASPNAASLGKYGDIPVSYHTGVPNISIPLYTVTSGSLKLPVSLSYHASGLKVEENASWVGAGWALNAGGAITRTVKDKPDERQTSSTNQDYGYYSDFGVASYFQNALNDNSNIDDEPDLFFFNFNSYSGKFVFNDDRTPVIIPEQDFKIECSYTPGIWNNSPGASNGFGRCIESFIITTPDGTKYYFGIPQTTVQNPYCDPIEVTSTYTATNGTSYSQVISSWFLNKIVSADGNFSINLSYTRDKYAFYAFTNPASNTIEPGGSNSTIYKYALVKNLMAGVLLSKITTANEKIDFTPGAARQDLSRWASGLDQSLTDNINQSSPTLGGIIISDASGNCYKKFNFAYDYFNDNSQLSTYFATYNIVSDQKRLRLLSVQEQNCDGSSTIPPYRFEYFAEQVPRKFSFARDHWGYINGATSNNQLYPNLYNNSGSINTYYGLDIANRESAWPAMRGGTLNKITYPTGGNTVFDFEPNKFTINKVVNSVIVPTDTTVGGLRIKTITSFDSVVNQSTVTNYSYQNQTNGLSSGVLYGTPVYIQVFRNDFLNITNSTYSLNRNGCWDYFDTAAIQARSFIFSDNPIRPMESTQGYHIGYGEVKVSQNNNGYSIYRFSVTPSWQVNRDYLATTKISNPGTCSILIPNYPAAPLPNDFYRGEPSYEGHFNQSGTAIAEKIYQTTYQENAVTTPGVIQMSFHPDPNSGFTLNANTFYEIKTAKKTQATILERTFQTGGQVLEKQTQTFYESNYHHEPTRVLTTDSKGVAVESKSKYAFDYRVPLFENVSNCYTASAGFISYMNSLYYSSYVNQFNSCTTITCVNNLAQNFLSTLFTTRKSYVDCRKTNFTRTDSLPVYRVNHNAAKAAANSELKPILWMQDINMNSPIEFTEWRNSQLINAAYIQYNNLRADSLGVYPEKSFKIDLAAASASFTASSVAADNISITKDSRYTLAGFYDYNKGNVISVTGRDSIANSYDWGYNKYFPIVKISNAKNKFKESLQPGTVNNNFSFQLGPANPTSGSLVTTFNQTQAGTITVSLPALPSNAQATCSFTLSGPVNQSGYICASGSGGASCSTTPSSISYSNMPVGQYTLSAAVNTNFGSYTFTYFLNYSYQGMLILESGLKEFFYEGFEESYGSSISSDYPHTGKNYWNTNYTTAFTLPNSRNYIIQWWNLVNGKWYLNQQPFTTNTTLTGPVDDIRIFPTDAQIATYTYDPVKGITSQWDVNNKIAFYEYDAVNRLTLIRDQDKNILKKICYTYTGQTESCTVPAYFNVVKSGIFTRNNCPQGYTPSSVTYTVAAGIYNSTISQVDADQKAVNDVAANGQNYANTNGACTPPVTITGTTSFNCAGTKTSSGIISAPSGYLVTVNLSAGGASGSYTMSVTISGGVNMTNSVTNGSTNFTFTMPASGSVNWSGTLTCPNTTGSGLVSVQ